jgi:hypothetical protein
MQRTEAVQMFAQILALFPNAPELMPEAQGYWIDMLEKHDPEVAAHAANAVLHECKFFPSIAEWQEKAQEARERLRPVRQQASLPSPLLTPPMTQAHRDAAAKWLPIVRETIAKASKPKGVRGLSSLAENLGAGRGSQTRTHAEAES